MSGELTPAPLGQTSVCRCITEQLGHLEQGAHSPVVMISQDSFYKVLNAEQREAANEGEYNFDHPGDAWRAREGTSEARIVPSQASTTTGAHSLSQPGFHGDSLPQLSHADNGLAIGGVTD